MLFVGRRIYPFRGALGVPLMVCVLVLCRPYPDSDVFSGLLRVAVGWIFLACGLFMRVWGVASWFTRDRSGVIGGNRLMIGDGPYPYTRNPRYLGNLGMGLGASILAGVPWISLVYVVLWCSVHIPILVAEHVTLLASHGASYEGYRRRVPALVPRLDPAFPILPQIVFVNWRAGMREETTTISGWISLGLLLHYWRVAHLVGWASMGPQWLYVVFIGVALFLGEKVRRSVPLEMGEDRPTSP